VRAIGERRTRFVAEQLSTIVLNESDVNGEAPGVPRPFAMAPPRTRARLRPNVVFETRTDPDPFAIPAPRSAALSVSELRLSTTSPVL